MGKRWAQFSIFLFLLISCSAVINLTQAASKICQYCKKPVQTTQFLLVEGNYYCSNHFRCANCDKSIGEEGYFKEGGKYYDHRCYFQLFGPKCAVCGNTIDGKYITFEQKSYHDSCYNRSVALRCAYCGEMISGEYSIDYWGNNYHASHHGNVPECNYCTRLISQNSNGGQTYSDGRTICGICSETGITTLEQMNALVQEVHGLLLAKGIEIPLDETRNHLVDRKELSKITKRHEPDIQGLAKYKESRTIKDLLPIKKEADVYMLRGIPRIKAIQVLAHELMHLWQFYNAKRNAEAAVEEGTASYASWLLLSDIDVAEADYLLHNMEKNPDPVYGEGYRRIRKFAQTQNIDSFLEYLKKNKKMPAGY